MDNTLGGRKLRTHTKFGRMLNDMGLRAYQVGARAGISPRTITEYVAGRKRPSNKNVARLCQVLGCEPEDLLETDEFYANIKKHGAPAALNSFDTTRAGVKKLHPSSAPNLNLPVGP